MQMCSYNHVYCLSSYEQFLEIQQTFDVVDFKMYHLNHL